MNLKNFQDKLSDIETIARDLKEDFAELKKEMKPTIPTEPKWYEIGKSYLGTKENTSRLVDNPVIAEWGKYIDGYTKWDDDDAWCAVYANAMLEKAGFPGTRKPLARSFIRNPNFIKLNIPIKGCITVLWRVDPNSWQGHVGFYEGENGSHFTLLGGNQRNAVNFSKYSKDKFLGFYWPKGA